MRMRYCEISCDAAASSRCWENYGPTRTIAEAVKGAREAGWHVGPAAAEQDVCPECQKPAPEVPA